jgi:hypothetical protein
VFVVFTRPALQLITKFKPTAEEELMSALNMILLKCSQLPPAALLQEPPEPMRDMLSRCHKKFFATPGGAGGSGGAGGAAESAASRSPRVAGAAPGASPVDVKKAAFEQDLLSVGPGPLKNPNVSCPMGGGGGRVPHS